MRKGVAFPEDGCVSFTIAKEFKVKLTLQPSLPIHLWRLLALEILVQPAEKEEAGELIPVILQEYQISNVMEIAQRKITHPEYKEKYDDSEIEAIGKSTDEFWPLLQLYDYLRNYTRQFL